MSSTKPPVNSVALPLKADAPPCAKPKAVSKPCAKQGRVVKPKSQPKAKGKGKSKHTVFPAHWPAKKFFTDNRLYMMGQDWVSRHWAFGKLSTWMPAAAYALRAKFSPRELVFGTSTGITRKSHRAIPLNDTAPIYRQTLITDYFMLVQRVPR